MHLPKISESGIRIWNKNNKRHRIGGPASEMPLDYQAWWRNGKLHRIDRPVIIYVDEKW